MALGLVVSLTTDDPDTDILPAVAAVLDITAPVDNDTVANEAVTITGNAPATAEVRLDKRMGRDHRLRREVDDFTGAFG